MIVPRLLLALCLLVVSAGVSTPVAHADDPALRAAKRHFERGEKLYALTKFSEALDAYQLAFDAKPLPDFLFNIGQCYRNLGDYDAAIFSYKKYLTLEPAAPNRDRVEQLIADLESKQEHRDTQRLGLARPRPAPPPPESHRAIYQTWWFWTGVAVLAGAGGVVAYEATRSDGPPDTSLGNIVFGK